MGSVLKLFIGLALVFALYLLIKELLKCNKKYKAEEDLEDAKISGETTDLQIQAKKIRVRDTKKRRKNEL